MAASPPSNSRRGCRGFGSKGESALWPRQHDPGYSTQAHAITICVGGKRRADRLGHACADVGVGVVQEPFDHANFKHELDGLIHTCSAAQAELCLIRFTTYLLEASHALGRQTQTVQARPVGEGQVERHAGPLP